MNVHERKHESWPHLPNNQPLHNFIPVVLFTFLLLKKKSDPCNCKGRNCLLAHVFMEFSPRSSGSKAELLWQKGVVEQGCLVNSDWEAEQEAATERKG